MGHPSLACLELRKNKLVSCAGLLNMHQLTELYLNENEISDFKALRDLPALRKLDLNTNKIAVLSEGLPKLPSLEHLDLGANLIESPADGGLSLLECYASTLKTLIIAGNPFADALGDGVKREVLLTIPGIKMVNDEEVNEEDFQGMQELRLEREKEAEEAARAAVLKEAGEDEGEDAAEGEEDD